MTSKEYIEQLIENDISLKKTHCETIEKAIKRSYYQEEINRDKKLLKSYQKKVRIAENALIYFQNLHS